MKKVGIFFVLVLLEVNLVSAAVTGDDPFLSTGTEFLAIRWDDNHKYKYGPYYYHHPMIMPLFNSTNIYVDANDDGVWEYKHTKNAGEWLSFEVLPLPGLINPGARIHSDKPVIYKQYLRMYSHSCGWACAYYVDSESIVPPLNSLRNEYFIYNGEWTIVPQQSITVNVDMGNDGTVDNTISAPKLIKTLVTIPTGSFARVYSNGSFYLYNTIGVVGPASSDFYIQDENVSKLVVTEDDTLVEIDFNNDGHYDNSSNYSRGVYGLLQLNNGAHLHSNKPVTVYVYEGEYALPSTMIGSDVWSTGHNYVVGLFDNTTFHADDLLENNLAPELDDTVDANVEKPSAGPFQNNQKHVWSDKPLISKYYYRDEAHILGPYSAISTATHGLQKYLGAEEITTIETRVFNPFADTTAYNLTLNFRIPPGFTLPLGNSLEVSIQKKVLMNDSITESETVTVNPTYSAGEYIVTLSRSDSAILGTLEPMAYLNVQYQVVTPSAYGTFEFDSVILGYEAETWNMPE
ncbi:MAG: hypothetical protein V1921_08095 [Candidatus Altiarchaeota archaeon]